MTACYKSDKIMEWKYSDIEKPICYEAGEWDGKRSDEVVVETDIDTKHIARLYEGTMDGSKFSNWIESHDYEFSRKIVRWLALPQ